jgi:hypothetical protein
VLIAELCWPLPAAADPPAWAELNLELKRRQRVPEPPNDRRAERPAVGPAEFERRLDELLSRYDTAALVHWLRHGAAPGTAGRRLAEPLKAVPRRPGLPPTVFRRRPRLAGAAALVPALDAALSLPPRQLRPSQQPVGGYEGVTTRGAPERLLPHQFALEPLDFVRRFAEHELLYFRREEPHNGRRPERLVVLDQGVRTWGGVRLALTAAVLALLGKDRKRAGPLRLALAGADPFDPADRPEDEFADRLEASDLTPHPAETLSRALATSADGPRDVVLLTHPRCLREPALHGAAARRRTADRLFALAVDDDGRAELAEWRGGGAVRLRAFRVDLAAAEAVWVPAEYASRPAVHGAPPAWAGDVEPVAFPFRPGLVGEPRLLAFDAAGEWLLAAGPNGLLHLAKLDGAPVEVLPRACRGGQVLTQVDAVLGVAGGFVAGGRMPFRPALGTFRFDSFLPLDATDPIQVLPVAVAAHYDLTRRQVTLHVLGPHQRTGARWFALPDLHAVVARDVGGWGCALDLETGGRYPSDRTGPALTARAEAARAAAGRRLEPPPALPLLTPGRTPDDLGGPWVKAAGGAVLLGGVEPPWPVLLPTADGKQLLAGATVADCCQLAGQTLALVARRADRRLMLYLFRGPEGRVLGEYDLEEPGTLFRLSLDGRRLARLTWAHNVLVTDTADAGAPVANLGWAGAHPNLGVHLDRAWLKITIGKFAHTFTLDTLTLHQSCQRSHDQSAIATAHPRAAVPDDYGYDAARFPVAAVRDPWAAVVDVWGQVLLLDRARRLIATFLVRRGLAAVCLADGTRWGAAALIGGPPTPGAADAIGRALVEAGRG